MCHPVRLCLAFHNHQPVGNFDHVFEQTYYDSYLPFLDVFESYPELRISLHTSGPLMEWLEQHHADYLDRLARLVSQDRVEIIGGAFYEPILTMIPSRDRVGQIKMYTRWLEQRLGADVRGMWIPERVWEQSLTADLAEAGIQYTLLDDFHFRNAGLSEEQLFGYYVTEESGKLAYVFPGSERLRYTIPFADPDETIRYLRDIATSHPEAVVVFGDDGEKFGTWPDTKKHVYEDGWLRRFFDALTQNRDWLRTTTLSTALQETQPCGKIYLPEGSYREMTEWALPTPQQELYEDLSHAFESDERWHQIKRFIRGGYWRNFRVKYPEADEMYTRMMAVSRRLELAERDGCAPDLLREARRELYRGQCNCSYWHGAFGGIYLPHLRNAIFRHLIAADNLLDRAQQRPHLWVEATAFDWNLDGRQEVRLENDRMVCFLHPHQGGRLYELDVRSIGLNLLASLARRPEAYHRKVRSGPQQSSGVASIHDRVIFKQEGLDQRLQYDAETRKSLIDHFYPTHVSAEEIARGEAPELGNFTQLPFETRLRRNPDRIQVLLIGQGAVQNRPLQITKGVTLENGSSTLEIAYLLEGLSPHEELHFAVEFNLAGLPAGAEDRYFLSGDGQRLGHLGTRLDLNDTFDLGLTDEWLGIRAHWHANRPTHLWTFPLETVSQSEGGFELVHQSVVLLPHWYVRGDADGRWSVVMSLDLDTSTADSRRETLDVAAVST